MTLEEFIAGHNLPYAEARRAAEAYTAGETHFQDLLVAALSADFKDEEGALKFEREYPRTTELLKGI